MSRKHVRTGTDNPSSSTKAIAEKQLEISPMRIVNNQRNNSTSISKEDNGKAIAPKVYDDESHDTEEVYEDCVETHSSHGAFPDLTNTVDTEEVTTHAPAVTHETIRPHIHEIIEEQIYRDIHTHEVFHRIQPVYDVEFLPARHFVPGSDGGLVEVSEDDLPDCTGSNQKWRLDKRAPLYSVPSLSSDSPGRPGPALEQSVNSRPIDSELPDRLEKLQLETTDPETGIKSKVIHPDPLRSEPVNLKPIGPEDLQPMETRGTNNTGSDFGDLVEESWQSSAPRIF
ncbi:hypothetical protein F4821DRAFT_227193 [Hypoxylon rubiginosum]|uniref:Uncharacterized protein n=1 Tax=Hypoxylon rubiginosum TaxID=110542 RepID=A0ACC0DE17_9PEZI|nr:hypothetical protein F4821DRAFT_227193 [Hypoxylon rubiginosum]